ncbi:serine protease inhibitor 77Ba-like [Zerene cesonia]|uniref:serine protease inhibitor 77Ba-like n=1 Tax=Zerene cesonia TaxID=33412 RepID=UPI0018E58810|nr:serine protease inhibitor 77Ba-like [Zerene cesonia]
MKLYVIAVCYLFNFCRTKEAKEFLLSEKINNFTLELLFFTNNTNNGGNLVLSPVTVWTSLLVLGEGATGDTQKEIGNALRVTPSSFRKGTIRRDFDVFIKNHEVNSSFLKIQKLSGIFIDKNRLPEADFFQKALTYKTAFVPLDVLDSEKTNNDLRNLQASLDKVKPIDVNDLGVENDVMVPYSAVYFRGLWTYHFDTFFTTKQPFYNDSGKRIGEVEMMYNRRIFPNVYNDILQAQAVEVPFADDDKSMIVFLPYAGVSLHDAFKNFARSSFKEVIDEFQRTASATGRAKEILVVMPKIRTRTRVNLKSALEKMGVFNIFDSAQSTLPLMARLPVYANKFVHNVKIDLNEEGVAMSDAMSSAIGTRVGGNSFIANRPFFYFIVEKMTNTILFCGFYVAPA